MGPAEPSFIARLFGTGRFLPWFLLALALRGALFAVFLPEHGMRNGYWGIAADTGDSGTYFAAMDYYLDGPGYTPDLRMPGYGLPYLFFRLFTDPKGAAAVIIFLQLILGAMSVVWLKRCAHLLGASSRAQAILFLAFALYGPIAVWDVYVMTESFFISASIGGVLLLLKHRHAPTLRTVILVGAVFAWAFFMRPVYLVWFPVIMILAAAPFTGWKRWLTALLVPVPFLLADIPWTLRNWKVHHAFHPLTNGYLDPQVENGIYWPPSRLLQATGGRYTFWDPNAEIRWFRVPDWGHFDRLHLSYDSTAVGPWATSAHYPMDSLRAIRTAMDHWWAAPDTGNARDSIRQRINAQVDRHIVDYRATRPFQYQVMSRIRHLRHFLWHRGVLTVFRDWEHALSPLQRTLEWTFTALYGLIATSGCLSVIVILLRWRHSGTSLRMVALFALIATTLFPLVLRFQEARYLLPAIPWLLLCATILIDEGLRTARARALRSS